MSFYSYEPDEDDEEVEHEHHHSSIADEDDAKEFLSALQEALEGYATDPPTVGAIGFVWIADDGSERVAIQCRAVGLNDDALALLGMIGAPQLSQYIGGLLEGYEPQGE